MKNKVSSTHVSVKRRSWSWQQYLNEQKAEDAPLLLFTQSQSFPSRRAGFKVGMKLEGVDPLHPSMFCVLTIAEVIGCRLRLHIDGYSECYDFWVNADSAHIRPAGWCKDSNHKLHPPKGHSETQFDWPIYLQSTGSHAAPPTLFTRRTESCDFSVGMRLEAVDRKNPGLVCVASVADVIDDQLRVHFDNWDDTYDYWCDSSSPYIHPVGWCEEQGRPLTAPQGHPSPENFLWEDYLQETGSTAAPSSAFTLRAPHGFQVNHRLEAVDRRNPMLIRVATVTDTEDFRVKVHYDGWSQQFDVWCDSDLSDLHPVGWCQRTGHPLDTPPGSSPLSSPPQGVCPTPGCRGIGHIKGAKYNGHHSAFGCPYSDINMRKEVVLPDRLGGERVVTLVPFTQFHRGNHPDSIQVKMENVDLPLLPLGKRRMTDRVSQPTKFLRVKKEEKLHPGALGPAESSLQATLHQSVFLSAMSAQPGRDLSLCWEQHRKLLPGLTGVHAETVQQWSVQQVSDFVESLPGCEDQAKLFRDEQIDGRAFLLLTQRDIIRIMSIKLGPALKIYNSILMFKHAEDRNQSHTEDRSQSHTEDRNQSHTEDRNQSHNEDRNQSHTEDRSQSHTEDRNQSHTEDRNPSHTEDRNPSHTEDRSQSHTEDRNPSHTEDRNQSHTEDRNQSHTEDRNPSHTEDRNQSHTEDRNPSHTEDRNPSHTEDRNQSHTEDRNQSHTEDRNPSHTEDRNQSHTEDRNPSHTEDRNPSHTEDRNQSHTEDRNPSHTEDRNPSHTEDRNQSHTEDRNLSEDRNQSDTEDRKQSHTEERNQSHNEDRNQSHTEDRNLSHTENRNQSHTEDRNQSHTEERNQSNIQDRNQSHAEDKTHADDRNQSHTEDRSQSHTEDRNQSHTEERNQSNIQDRNQSHAEDRNLSHAEDKTQSHADDRNLSHTEDRIQLHVEDRDRDKSNAANATPGNCKS
ncbi:lethal(3)malignant brain tumor-like protein 4 isoform X3 [Labrus bergylta]|nr:lethal(3)malignant brain tumor-like protein 4 isoform X3 [Labrus bergylta]